MNFYTRCCTIFIFWLATTTLMAQGLRTSDLKNVKPTADYDNIESIEVYTDMNVTAFVVYVKKFVRKHEHVYHTEIVTILDGKGEMFMNGQTFLVKKGDRIIIPAGTAHGVITKSKKPLKVLSLQTPEFEGLDRTFLE